MSGFIHFPEAGLFVNPDDIIAAEADHTRDGTETLRIHLRRPNTTFTIRASHKELVDALRSVYESRQGGE